MELKTNDFKRQMQNTDFQQAENKQLVFSVADEMPYLRHDDIFGDYFEVLEISEDAINTTRLVKNMPFLKDHDHSAQLGAVKKFWLQDKKLYVSVKFSRSKFAQSIKEDIIDLIRQNTSIGYFVDQFIRTGEIDGIPVLRAVKWTPYECSSVSVPASVFVGYNRSIEIKEQKGVEMKDAQTDKITSDTELATKELEVEETDGNREDQNTVVEDLETKSEKATEVEEETGKEEKELCPDCNKPIDQCECKSCGQGKEEKACGEEKPEEKKLEPTAEELRIALEKILESDIVEIRSLGEIAGEEQTAQEFISQKRSLAQFKEFIKNKRSTKSQNSIQDKKKMENKYFSISKAIRNACTQYKADVSEEYETIVNLENKRSLGVDDADIVLTNAQLHQTRALGPSATVGAELINTDYLPQEFVAYLRPQLTLEKTGYYSIPVNGNAVSFAVCSGGATAGMYDLDGELSGSDLKFALKTLSPKKAGVCVPIPYSLILQGRPEVDAMVEADIVNALYQKRDEQILIGSGADGEATGILNTAGINTLTASVSGFGAWKACLSGVNEIRKANIFSENLSFVMNGDTYVELCTTPKNKDNCMAGFVIENDKIGTYPVYVNNAITGSTILVGDFGQVAVSDFQGLKLKVDDITYIKKQAIQVVAIKAFDVAVRRLGAFTKITLED